MTVDFAIVIKTNKIENNFNFNNKFDGDREPNALWFAGCTKLQIFWNFDIKKSAGSASIINVYKVIDSFIKNSVKLIAHFRDTLYNIIQRAALKQYPFLYTRPSLFAK